MKVVHVDAEGWVHAEPAADRWPIEAGAHAQAGDVVDLGALWCALGGRHPPPDRPLRLVTVDLRRPAIRQVGLMLSRPQHHPSEVRVQLFRPVPGIGLVPAPVLHRPGYQATPEKVAPLCSTDGGPYGRLVWIWADRTPPLKVCAACDLARATRPRPQPPAPPPRTKPLLPRGAAKDPSRGERTPWQREEILDLMQHAHGSTSAAARYLELNDRRLRLILARLGLTGAVPYRPLRVWSCPTCRTTDIQHDHQCLGRPGRGPG